MYILNKELIICYKRKQTESIKSLSWFRLQHAETTSLQHLIHKKQNQTETHSML